MTSKKKILIFGGGPFHDHESICPHLRDLSAGSGDFEISCVTERYEAFLADELESYDGVVLYHTGGELSAEQESGLTNWVKAGGGFVGIHCAADSFAKNLGYRAMLGGNFKHHPFIREFIVSLCDATPGIENGISHPITEGIEGYSVKDWEKWPVMEFKTIDEQYIVDYDERVDVLAATLFKGKSHPVAWSRPWGEGRVMYLALGHNIEACQSDIFKALYTRGFLWSVKESG